MHRAYNTEVEVDVGRPVYYTVGEEVRMGRVARIDVRRDPRRPARAGAAQVRDGREAGLEGDARWVRWLTF